jgi:hypothetical protein
VAEAPAASLPHQCRRTVTRGGATLGAVKVGDPHWHSPNLDRVPVTNVRHRPDEPAIRRNSIETGRPSCARLRLPPRAASGATKASAMNSSRVRRQRLPARLYGDGAALPDRPHDQLLELPKPQHDQEATSTPKASRATKVKLSGRSRTPSSSIVCGTTHRPARSARHSAAGNAGKQLSRGEVIDSLRRARPCAPV